MEVYIYIYIIGNTTMMLFPRHAKMDSYRRSYFRITEMKAEFKVRETNCKSLLGKEISET
jgi:hypothetical protein